MSAINALSFEHAKEAFDQGVVGATANTAHAAGYVVAFQESLILSTRELAAAIGMQYERRSFLSLPEGHKDCLKHQLAILNGTHRPTDDQSRVQIDNHAEIQPGLGGANVSDIRCPLGVRFRSFEVAIQVVLYVRWSGLAGLFAPAALLRDAARVRHS
jgi:hypothetical protein